MHARVGGHARSDATQSSPQARVAASPGPLEQPAREAHATLDRQTLEPRQEFEHFFWGPWLEALGALQLGIVGRNERFDQIANGALLRLTEPAGNAPPADEELLPTPALGAESKALGKQRPNEGHALLIEQIAEPGPQAEADQHEVHPLVVQRATPRLVFGGDHVEQSARDFCRPSVAHAEDALELTHQVLGLALFDVLAAFAEHAGHG